MLAQKRSWRAQKRLSKLMATAVLTFALAAMTAQCVQIQASTTSASEYAPTGLYFNSLHLDSAVGEGNGDEGPCVRLKTQSGSVLWRLSEGKTGDSEFCIGTDTSSSAGSSSSNDAKCIITANDTAVRFNTQSVQFQSVTFSGDVLVGAQKQWKLFYEDNFRTTPNGWTVNDVSVCGGVHMLGGYAKFAGGEVAKTFTGLPPHEKVRVVATYHFIDAWSGESAFLRADVGRDRAMNYVWTEKYDFGKSQGGIDVCGAAFLEGRFAAPVDVTLPHTYGDLTLGFGSTLDEDPYENSFGVSNLQIYIM